MRFFCPANLFSFVSQIIALIVKSFNTSLQKRLQRIHCGMAIKTTVRKAVENVGHPNTMTNMYYYYSSIVHKDNDMQ